MSFVELIAKLKPKNNGKFALMDAVDVEMADGTRLEDKVGKLEKQGTDLYRTVQVVEDSLEGLTGDAGSVKNYIDEETSTQIVDNVEDIPPEDGIYHLDPDIYYVFGRVDSLSVRCNDPKDGKIHEFAFEFIPSENFEGLDFGEEPPSWATTVQYPVGKTCQVSIVRNVGVMISA